MILPALVRYYKRLEAGGVAIPKPGYAEQKVHFEILLEPDGKLFAINDLRTPNGKKLAPRVMQLPSIARSGSALNSQFTWDNTQYVLGAVQPDQPKKKRERAPLAFAAFRDRHIDRLKEIKDVPVVAAFLRFIKEWSPDRAAELDAWEDICGEAGPNFVFRLRKEKQYLHDHPKVEERWRDIQTEQADDPIEGFCLIGGERTELARLHPMVKGVDGGQARGGSLVGFNNQAFTSYGKDQSYNAPTGTRAAFEYSTALSYLLRRDGSNRHRMKIVDMTVGFWAESDTCMETYFGEICDPPQSMDESEAKKLGDFLERIRDGRLADIPDLHPETRFYILGLTPNSARLVVRFWCQCTVGKLADNLASHYRDIEMIRAFDRDPRFPSIWQIIRQTARETKDISPLLNGQFAQAVFQGSRYPDNLLGAVMNRIRADQTINYLRAALIRALLVRNRKENIPVTLDTSCTDIGYVLGRLFAVLEKIQEEAQPGINATIKDRCFTAASATPVTVFPRLVRLSNHHLGKLENVGRRVNFERLLGKIIDCLSANDGGFPAHLAAVEQGKFIIGYYQQRTDFFTTKENSEEEAVETAS